MLKQRVITAAIAGLVVLFVLLFGNVAAWKWLVYACSIAAYIEYAMMFKARPLGAMTGYGFLLVTAIEWFPHFFYHPMWMFMLVAVVLVVPVFSRQRVSISAMAIQTAGALYISFGGYALGQLRGLEFGWFWLWLLLVSVWMSDTAAYFVGRFVQGPKLLPEVSPKKTMSGSLGGIVGASVGAVVFGLIAHPVEPLWVYAVLGALISITAQLGDLIESAYKRQAGVKDSGKMLPGHGGMLDRVDSLLFAAPFALWLIHLSFNFIF